MVEPEPQPLEELDPGPAYVRGALLAGVPTGLFGALCCCCISIPVAGVLGAQVASKQGAYFGLPEGLATGALAGAVAWLVSAMIQVPQALLVKNPFMQNPDLLRGFPPELQEALMRQQTVGEAMMFQALALLAYVIGGALAGGIAGQTALRKEPPG